MSAITKLTRSASGQVRSRIKTLAGALPHEDEEWTYSDTELTWSDMQWLSDGHLRDVESDGRAGAYRTPRRLAEAVRHYADACDVNYPGDDPLPRLSD